jgi:hypothetical protein
MSRGGLLSGFRPRIRPLATKMPQGWVRGGVSVLAVLLYSPSLSLHSISENAAQLEAAEKTTINVG